MQPYLEEAVRASHLPYLLMMSSVTGQLPDGNGPQGGRDSLLLPQRSAWQHSCTQQMFYTFGHLSRAGACQSITTGPVYIQVKVSLLSKWRTV